MNDEAPSLSVVLPCYNEAGNVPMIFQRFREVLAGREDIEVLLVNNGSTDDSSEVFARECARPEHDFARVITVPDNQGYGHGILAGLAAARAPFLGWTHADMQTDPADVLRALDLLRSQEAPREYLVRGRRRKRAFFDTLFTWGMGVIASTALRTPLHDVNAQPKLFARSFFDTWDDPPNDFSLDLYCLVQAARKNLRVLEVEVVFADRLHGEAKGGGSLQGKWKLIRRTWAYIFGLRRRLGTATS